MFGFYDKKWTTIQSNKGWLSELELCFALKGKNTVLIKNRHTGPFMVQKSFYPEHDKTTPHVCLLHLPGGLVGGDQLKLLVNLESNSKALLTTPSSNKFYRTNGQYILQKQVFRVKNGAVIEWIPQSSIFFPNTKVRINTTFYLEKDTRFISFEILCFENIGFLGLYNYPEEVDIFIYICLSGSVGFRDRLIMNKHNFIEKLGGFRVSAVLFAIPSSLFILKQVRELIHPIKNIQIGGATLLDDLLVVRLLGNDSYRLEELLYDIWSTIRPVVIGKTAVKPRVWSI